MTNRSTEVKAPGERVLWVCLAVCLAAALAAPLFGDDPRGVVIPLVAAGSVVMGIAWLRKKQTQ
ncbi:hypothetical protein ACSNOH_22815 [Streptomyces sp. URMC 127]|uniref:hypothetical protein n=1 Tax=Streptomyces sp. URMC 127 TaxID=3423402 RepID=UPI003F1BE282